MDRANDDAATICADRAVQHIISAANISKHCLISIYYRRPRLAPDVAAGGIPALHAIRSLTMNFVLQIYC